MTSFVNGRKSGGLSLRAILIGATSVLSVLLVFAFGRASVDAWQDYSRSEEVKSFDMAANQLIKGLFEVLMERLYTNNALQSQDVSDDAAKKQIEASREIVRNNYDVGLEALKQRSFPNKDRYLAELNPALAKVNDYRAQADRAVTAPYDTRDETLLKTFIATFTASVDASLKVWFSALHASSAEDPTLAKLAVIKELGFRMRDQAGKERSRIASAISSGSQISAETLASNVGIREQVDLLWKQLDNLTAGDDTHPEIKAAMALAQKEYFDSFRKLADEMGKASENGANYPMDVTSWVATTTPKLGTLLNVMYAAGTASEEYNAEVQSGALTTLVISLVMLAIGVLAAGMTILFIIRRVSTPLTELAACMSQLAAGDKTTVISGIERSDEIGRMASAVQVFKENMIKAEEMEAQEKSAQEERDRRSKELEAAINDFQSQIAERLEALRGVSGELTQSADSLTQVAGETREQGTGAQTASTQTASNVQSVSAAAEEMDSSFGEIVGQVTRASSSVQNTSGKAQETLTLMEDLQAQSESIAQVIELINGISEQTNLLALNATIEAARAGEAGKGFAVVASEVKSLATQTGKATEEIAMKIQRVQQACGTSVDSVRAIVGSIEEVNEISAAISAAVEQQKAATSEITRNMQEAARGTEQLLDNIARVNQASDRSASIVSSVTDAAKRNDTEAGAMKNAVDRFIQRVQAA